MSFQRNIDLHLLECFAALMRELNVSRAAERMGLSQSAMSEVLARLRERFDDPLLVRGQFRPPCTGIQGCTSKAPTAGYATSSTGFFRIPAQSRSRCQLSVFRDRGAVRSRYWR